MTEATPLPRRGLGRAARDGDGRARAGAASCSRRPSRGARAVGDAQDLIPAGMRRATPPTLPELSEFEVQRHYLHLSQETLGMMGISLFGTCTMKYNPRVGEEIAARPEIAELHPHQHDDTLQGVLEIVHGLDLILRELSGMDQFVFQAGGGADAAYTHACVTRAYHASRGELEQRNEIDHDDPGAPVQRGDGRRGGLQRHHAAARGGRLPVARGAARPPSPTAPRR